MKVLDPQVKIDQYKKQLWTPILDGRQTFTSTFLLNLIEKGNVTQVMRLHICANSERNSFWD